MITLLNSLLSVDYMSLSTYMKCQQNSRDFLLVVCRLGNSLTSLDANIVEGTVAKMPTACDNYMQELIQKHS